MPDRPAGQKVGSVNGAPEANERTVGSAELDHDRLGQGGVRNAVTENDPSIAGPGNVHEFVVLILLSVVLAKMIQGHATSLIAQNRVTFS